MPAMLRILAITLLALAVPVQGFAAVTAGQCMALGHHEDGGDQGHGHGQQGGDRADHQHAGDGEKSSHCGPCTACCASASISAAMTFPILPSQSNAKHVFFELPRHGIQPPGFDRPPLAL